MTKTAIIERIYDKKIPESAWRKAKDSLFEDYRQEMYLLLLEMPDEKFFDLVSRNKLEDYFYRLCRLQAGSKSLFNDKIFGRLKTKSLSEKFNYDFDD